MFPKRKCPLFYLNFLSNRLPIEIILLYLYCQTRTNNNPLTTDNYGKEQQQEAYQGGD